MVFGTSTTQEDCREETESQVNDVENPLSHSAPDSVWLMVFGASTCGSGNEVHAETLLLEMKLYRIRKS
jgi:hypothetical protein